MRLVRGFIQRLEGGPSARSRPGSARTSGAWPTGPRPRCSAWPGRPRRGSSAWAPPIAEPAASGVRVESGRGAASRAAASGSCSASPRSGRTRSGCRSPTGRRHGCSAGTRRRSCRSRRSPEGRSARHGAGRPPRWVGRWPPSSRRSPATAGSSSSSTRWRRGARRGSARRRPGRLPPRPGPPRGRRRGAHRGDRADPAGRGRAARPANAGELAARRSGRRRRRSGHGPRPGPVRRPGALRPPAVLARPTPREPSPTSRSRRSRPAASRPATSGSSARSSSGSTALDSSGGLLAADAGDGDAADDGDRPGGIAMGPGLDAPEPAARPAATRIRLRRPGSRPAARRAARPRPGPGRPRAVGPATRSVRPSPRASDKVERLLDLIREELSRTDQRRLPEIEPGRWWLADRDEIATAAAPLADRVEWAVFSLLSTAGPLAESAFFERIAALFTGHDLPDEALVRACLQSYRSRASTADRIVTGDDLLRRAQEHAELIGAPRRRRAPAGDERLDRAARAGPPAGRRAPRRLPRRARAAGVPRPTSAGPSTTSPRSTASGTSAAGRVPVRGRVDGDARRAAAAPPRPDPAGRAARPVPRHRPGADRARPPQARAVAAPARGDGDRDNWHILKWNHLRAFLGRDEPTSTTWSRSSGSTRSSSGRRADAAVRAADRPPSGSGARPLPPARYPDGHARPPRPRPEATRDRARPLDLARRRSSPTASGRRILELNPTTATVYGDERYDDRLEDPARPAGRRPASSRSARSATPTAIPTDGLSIEDRITRDMLIGHRRLAVEEDDQGIAPARASSTRWAARRQLLPQICQFQPADTPERLEQFIARLHAYPAFMAANIEHPARGARQRA